MHENIQLSQETAPTPNQLSRLASGAMMVASRMDRIRPLRVKERANCFVHSTDYLEIDDDTDGITTNTHNMSFRVARRVHQLRTPDGMRYDVPIPEWNMQIFDTHWFNSDSAEAIGIRSVYFFEWNKRQTTRAEKNTRAVPVPDDAKPSDVENDLDSIIAGSRQLDSTLELLSTEMDYSQMNRSDVEYLADGLSRYYQTLEVR